MNVTTTATDEDESYGVLVYIDATTRAIVDGCVGCAIGETYELMVILTRIMGILSFMGSLYVVIGLTWKRSKRIKNMKSTFNRLLLILSIFDMISSIAFFFANWPIPASPPNDGMYDGQVYISQKAWDSRYPGSKTIDSKAACSTQGFFIHFGILGSTFATGFIALQTLLMVRYSWTERQMRKAEKVFFTILAIYPLTTAIVATSMGLMNPLPTAFCWIEVPVVECFFESRHPLLEDYCEEINPMSATNYLLFKLVLGFAVIFFTLVLVFCSMVSLYLSVRTQERRAARWSSNAAEGRAQRKVFTKGMLYISAYLIVWIPSVLAVSLDADSIGPQGGLLLNTIVSIFLPLQGCFNALIYSGALDICCKSCKDTSNYASSAMNASFRRNKKKKMNSNNGDINGEANNDASANIVNGNNNGGTANSVVGGRRSAHSGIGRSVGGGRGSTSTAANDALLQDRTSSSARASQASMTERMTDVNERE